jgi:prevent-host-death family protein
MNISIRELKAHLSHYLQLTQAGEVIVVTSRNHPIARFEAIADAPADWPAVPALKWAEGGPKLTRSQGQTPTIEGETLADWILRNRG